jgi:hypothetical protein
MLEITTQIIGTIYLGINLKVIDHALVKFSKPDLKKSKNFTSSPFLLLTYIAVKPYLKGLSKTMNITEINNNNTVELILRSISICLKNVTQIKNITVPTKRLAPLDFID